MKILLGIIFMAVGVLVGKNSTDKYSSASKYYSSMLEFNRDLISNLEYKRVSVHALIKDKKYFSEDFSKTLNSAFGNDEDIFLPKYLDDAEKQQINDYLNNIGKSTKDAELQFLKFAEHDILKSVNKYAEENKKYGDLGIKLGFAAGAAAFILIL